MNIRRQEIRTGLLVIISLVVFVAMLIYLGAPGFFSKQKKFRIFFDNAADMKPGAPVLLAGRKIGFVSNIFSPVPEKDRPQPKLEVFIEVQVEANAAIYNQTSVAMAQPRLLGEPVIDFSNGVEASGVAPDGAMFIGERPGGVAEAVPMIIAKIDPALVQATATLELLQKTANNLNALTAAEADLPKAFAEFRKTGANLTEMSAPNGPLRKTLENVQQLTGDNGKFAQTLDNLLVLTGPESRLAKAMSNAEQFTGRLANSSDLETTLRETCGMLPVG